MSRDGIRLMPPYIGAGQVLTGSSRVAQEAKEKAPSRCCALRKLNSKQEALDRKRSALEAQIRALQMRILGPRNWNWSGSSASRRSRENAAASWNANAMNQHADRVIAHSHRNMESAAGNSGEPK